MESEVATSASPPDFEKGTASLETINILMIQLDHCSWRRVKGIRLDGELEKS
jgi:hypothetical protein